MTNGAFENLDVGGKSVRLYASGIDVAKPGVVVYHAWWGLNDDVLAYADRLADAGFSVVAPDLFGGQVATTQEDAKTLAQGSDEEAINGIALATIDRLAESLDADARMAAVGFSFGAHWAMWSPTQRDRVVASVLYYGTTGDGLTEASVPVLGNFAEDDPFEDDEWLAEFEKTLRDAGREVTIHRYPGTGHWFAEPSKDAYRPEAADQAFERTVDFLRTQLRAGAPAR